MRARRVVLILTHGEDTYSIDCVAAAVARRGVRAFRFDTDRFPLEAALALAPPVGSGTLEVASESLELDDVSAVWLRHVGRPRLDPDLDPSFAAACDRECGAALRGFFDLLDRARWVNPPGATWRAESKPLQLREARSAGLKVPRTLLTNDAGKARAFFDEMGGRVVAKMLTPLTTSMGAPSAFVYTSDVDVADLEDDAALRLCPMVFQERIDKARELRVVLAGGRVFAGAIDARDSKAGRVDWRLASPDECAWERTDLRADVAERIAALLERLGLTFGVADVIVTPAGEHVFLELNPCGEWGMLERDLGLPISEAITDALLS